MLTILIAIIAIALLPWAINTAWFLFNLLVIRLWPLWALFGVFVVWAAVGTAA